MASTTMMRTEKGNKPCRLLYVGGNANNGSACGLSYSNSNNGFSNTNTNIGSRLKFSLKKLFNTVEPVSMEEFSIPTERR